MTGELKRTYSVKCKEIQIDCDGLSFLVICGTHINGGFASIVNFGLSYELSDDAFDVEYNASQIAETLCTLENNWLPASEDRRKEIAFSLSLYITDTISKMK